MRRTRAFTLRTFPFGEADRVVILFSEDEGILRGVARGSLKMKSRITGALEPLTLVNLRFVEPHGRDMVVITGCDAVRSLYHRSADLAVASAIGLLTEITLETHADRDPNEPFFRLLELCQQALAEGTPPAQVMRYFELFTLRLTGVLPPTREIVIPEVRNLATRFLKTNLLALEPLDARAVEQLGNWLRRELQQAFGIRIRAYDFAGVVSRRR